MTKRSLKQRNEDDLLKMLTSRDEREAVMGRFLATGITEQLLAFVRAEEEVGHSGSTAMLASTAAVGLVLGAITGWRTEDFTEPGVCRVSKAAGRLFAREFEAGIRAEARRHK